MLDKLRNELTTHWAWNLGQHIGSGQADRGQVSTLITVVTIGLVAIIGILIFDDVYNTAYSGAETDLANNTRLENTSSEVASGFGDAIDLVPVVLLVLVASLVIAVVQQF